MKKTLAIIILLGAISCQVPENGDLDSMKSKLAEKKSELRDLQDEIKQLTADINELEPANEKEAVPIVAEQVEQGEFKRFVEIQGRVEADDIVNVSSEVGGRIAKLFVGEGDYVRKGQLVAVTDLSTLEKQIEELENNLSLATTVFERQKRLWDQNIGSEIQYLEAKTNKEGLEKSLATLESQISKKNIYSPISGYVDREFMQAGETASPGMPIIQILNTSKIKVVADVQENFLKSIKRGDPVEISFPALGIDLNEKISQIGRTIDLTNRTFEIEVETDSKDGQLKPNLLAVIRFQDFEKSDILSIPLDVVQEEVNGRKFVYLVKTENGDTIARKSYVEIGESNVNEVIIESGIQAGDLLITRGAKTVSDGDLIKINS